MFLDKYLMIYIGYFTNYTEDIILCMSDDISKVKYYIKKVRQIPKSNYVIREIPLDYHTAESMYGEYVLEEFSEEYLYLTRRDIDYLSREINSTLNDLEDLCIRLNDYKSILEYGSSEFKFREDIEAINQLMYLTKNRLGKVKSIRRMSKGIIGLSPVTSSNIEVYLNCMKNTIENRELLELFYSKIDDEKE